MNWRTRLSFMGGLLALGVLCAGLAVYVNYSSSLAVSQTARLQASTYGIGIDYSGLVTKQFVQPGDEVHAGQDLFYIKSTALVQSLHDNSIRKSDLLYPLTSDNQIILRATKSGIVQGVAYPLGSFVPQNNVVVTLVDNGSLEVDATYRLSPKDYNAVTTNTTVLVRTPDGNTTAAEVTSVTALDANNPVSVEVRAAVTDIDYRELSNGQSTPVTATLILRPNTWWDSLRHYLHF